MFNTSIDVATKFMERGKIYPRKYNIKIVDRLKMPENISFKEDTHDYVVITTEEGGQLESIIHKSLSKMLLNNKRYKLWIDRPDQFDRYFEIVDIEFVTSQNKQQGKNNE